MAKAVTSKTKLEKLEKKAKLHNYYDYSLLILVMFIAAFGLIMVYSSSSYVAQAQKDEASTYFMYKQAFAMGLGIVAMFMVSKINYRILIKRIPVIKLRMVHLLYFLAIILQALVLILPSELNGSKRWIQIIPGLSFQPSEFTKIVVIVMTAYIIYLMPEKMNNIFGFLRVALICGIPILLVIIENLSTAIVLSAIMFVMCVVASKKRMYYWGVMAAGGAAGIIYLILGPEYRVQRILQYGNESELSDQIREGLYAIASGGLFGTGLGESIQKLGYIPEVYNDMIFTVICEELGLFGAVIVIILFLLLLWRIFTVAMHAPDLFGSLLCVGALIHIAAQVIINVAVVTNLFPSTGIPLPFISYGGTSVLFLFAEMGMVLSVSNQIKGYQ